MNELAKNIVVAGASGYIGRALIPKLRATFPNAQITALSRAPRNSEDSNVTWKACDLFSLKDLQSALPEKVDIAYYLVHSMIPTAHLDQGAFSDYDLILADNFARALKQKNPSHLIYLGGIIPQGEELSTHLASRREVESVFAEHGLQPTVFRAGMVIGPHGSSFEILEKLVERLPVMICPKWTLTKMSPVDIDSAVTALADAPTKSETIGRKYDLSSCRPVSYLEMMRETAKWMGKNRAFIPVPFFSARLSRYWVSLVSGKPQELVYPLVESLRHPMIARNDYLAPPQITYAELLRQMPEPEREHSKRARFTAPKLKVRSVQRMRLPQGWTAEDVKEEFMRWVPRFMSPFFSVWLEGRKIVFSLINKKLRLLELTPADDRNSSDRQLFYITGGALTGGHLKGRLEFREVLNKRFVLAAVHEYHPALPWYVYQQTQARVHLLVMRAFGWHLKQIKDSPKRRKTQPRPTSYEARL